MTKSDIIRLSAWTYQRDNPVFDAMTESILRKAENVAAGVESSLLAQEYTYLANMASCPSGTTRFFKAFLRRFDRYKKVRGDLTKGRVVPYEITQPGAPVPEDHWYGSSQRAEAEKRHREQSFPRLIHTITVDRQANRYWVRTQAALPLHDPVTVLVGVNGVSTARVQHAFKEVPIKNWVKAVSVALMDNENATQDLSDDDVRNLAEAFYELMNDFLVSATSFDHHRSLFRGMMFLLKRRRFDKTFLKNPTGDDKVLFDNLNRIMETTHQYTKLLPLVRTLAAACRSFLNGKGHLLDLPAVLSLDKESQSDDAD